MASIECAQELLRHKADCCGSGGRSAVDDDGKTALHWAALNNNVRLIDELITHGANKDAQDNKVFIIFGEYYRNFVREISPNLHSVNSCYMQIYRNVFIGRDTVISCRS